VFLSSPAVGGLARASSCSWFFEKSPGPNGRVFVLHDNFTLKNILLIFSYRNSIIVNFTNILL